MALLGGKVCVLSAFALLVLLAAAGTRAEDSDADGVFVETEEEEPPYQSPTVDPKKVYIAEHFDDEQAFNARWVKSEAKKEGVDENIAKYDGKWQIQEPSKPILKGDRGLVLRSEASHAAIAATLSRPFHFKDKPLIVQYEVTMQEGQNCGGAYLKLLSSPPGAARDELRRFNDRTPYTIMFGPDKCGSDNKLHFIFRHKNPKNGTIEEKHCKKPKDRLEDLYKDKQPHLYSLELRPDNTFTINVDGKPIQTGSLLEDFQPPVNPPEEIDDPDDKKPADWDEREKIPDPDARKPEDWDESAPAELPDPHAERPAGWLDDEPDTVPDPTAERPADWDDDMDGEWEPPRVDNPRCAAAPGCGRWQPPMVKNPDYKGPWRAPLVANPNYRGKWTPRRIPNPHYFKDDHPFRMTPIYAVGFELWSMSPQLLFDNLLITDDADVAAQWTSRTFALKQEKLAKDSRSLWGAVTAATGGRPGWWAAYAAYVALPVLLYVAFLVRRIGEDSFVERVWRAAAGSPALYGGVALGVVLALGYLLYWLCKDSPDREDTKKTDGWTADDDSVPSSARSVDDADADVTPEGEGGAGAGPEAEGEEEIEVEPEPTAADSTPLVDADGGGDGHRKRRARRE